jgi:hypothetical protein
MKPGFALAPRRGVAGQSATQPNLGDFVMRTQGSSSLPKPSGLGNDLTEREVRDFLRALRTYPDQFARNPQLSFQQHLFEVAAVSTADSPQAKAAVAS